jgi:excisionase family DNA binding protein
MIMASLSHLAKSSIVNGPSSVVSRIDRFNPTVPLRIPHSPVYKLAQLGKIPAQKVGRHWRFHRDTLLDWIAGKDQREEKNP